VDGLTRALVELASDESGRFAMARAALVHVAAVMSWENRVHGAMKLVVGVGHAN